jgi:hypothetical protein
VFKDDACKETMCRWDCSVRPRRRGLQMRLAGQLQDLSVTLIVTSKVTMSMVNHGSAAKRRWYKTQDRCAMIEIALNIRSVR